MKTQAQVSVIIPTYNSEKHIINAIESVQNQSFENWECIVVDDGSADSTIELVQHVREQDNRVKLIKLPHYGNANVARNIGIKSSTGSYIAMLDSDDMWLEEHLRNKLSTIGNYAGVYSGHYELIDGIKQEKTSRQIYDSEDPFYFIFFSKNYATTPSLFFEKEPLLKVMWDPNIRRHQDYDLLIRFLQKYKMKFDENVTVLVNRNPKENSSFNFEGCIEFYNKYIDNFEKYPKESIKYLIGMSKRAFLMKKYSFALTYFKLSEKYSHQHLNTKDKAYRRICQALAVFSNKRYETV